MKKLSFVLIIITIYCSSCSKNKVDTSPYYIKAMFNGQEKTFLDDPAAAEYSGDITAGFSMKAKDNSANTSVYLGIMHPFGVKITEGVYKEISNGYEPSGNYVIEDKIFYASGFILNASTIQIAISNLTNTTVSGTFSGKLNNTANDSIIITNGTFNLPVHQ